MANPGPNMPFMNNRFLNNGDQNNQNMINQQLNMNQPNMFPRDMHQNMRQDNDRMRGMSGNPQMFRPMMEQDNFMRTPPHSQTSGSNLQGLRFDHINMSQPSMPSFDSNAPPGSLNNQVMALRNPNPPINPINHQFVGMSKAKRFIQRLKTEIVPPRHPSAVAGMLFNSFFLTKLTLNLCRLLLYVPMN